MKNWKRICAVCAMAAALTFGCQSMAFAAAGEISVSGSGVVLAKPDTATIWLEVETGGKTSEAAQKENNRILGKVTDKMLEMGVEKEKLVTTSSYVYPYYQYEDETGKRTITGYRSSTSLQVVTKDVDNAGQYIDEALKAGATGTNGVSFSVEDQSAYYAEALRVAVRNAADSAEAIAGAYGRPLGEVKSVAENSRNAYFVESAADVEMEALMDNGAMKSAKTGGGTTIRYGNIQISADISVVYAF